MRVLVTGTPRSGTTWVGSVLGATDGAAYVHEPDETSWRPYALVALRGLSTAPSLEPGDTASRAYERLWDVAFGEPVHYLPGQQQLARAVYERTTPEEREAALDVEHPRLSARLKLVSALAIPAHHTGHGPRVVKSVRLACALDWVVARERPAVVVCFRHPLDVVASALDLGWRARVGALRPSFAAHARRWGTPIISTDDVVDATAWWVGMRMSLLGERTAAHPEYLTVDHAALCADPVGELRRLVDGTGLTWTPVVESLIVASDRPGTGNDLTRVAAEQRDRWRDRLAPDAARRAAAILRTFPIASRYDIPDLG